MEEHYLLTALKQGSKEAFSFLFTAYYKDLVLFGGNFLPDREACEDIVQSVFLKLWADRFTLEINTSLKSYLLRSVRNSCLDEIRHKNIVRQHEAYTLSASILDDLDTDNYILYSDLNQHLQEALMKIPEAYRSVFEMNRFKGMKYKEIAIQMNVSERTVEVRIGKTLELLRQYLKEFLIVALIIWFVK